MSKFVEPKVFFIGYTAINYEGLKNYLIETDNEEFLDFIEQAKNEGLSDGEILCSFYAKLCYASLTVGKNNNISKVRDIEKNLLATIESCHGSVFEHCSLNFVTTNCSRVYTHEQVRHRVGTAYSQTSGRYVRTDEIGFVFDPILNPVEDDIREVLNFIEEKYKAIEEKLGVNKLTDFSKKKKITSAMRRILPNGQSNELGFSLNLRTLRQTLQARTSRHAEWEIRFVYNRAYELICAKYPTIFADCSGTEIDGELELVFKNRI